MQLRLNSCFLEYFVIGFWWSTYMEIESWIEVENAERICNKKNFF